MRNYLIAAALTVMAGIALADPQYVPLECRVGTNAAAVATDSANPRGYVQEILFQAPTTNGAAVSTVTSVVTIVSAPNVGSGITSTVLYTNAAMTAAAVARPRVTQHDNTGANLSTMTVAERFLCAGDPITFRVAQSSGVTGVVFKCWLKIDQ